MSRRRSAPNDTKASARFDLLARVICSALFESVGTALVTDPGFTIDAANLALPEETDPAREQPTGDQRARQVVAELPENKCERPFRRRGADDRVRKREEPVMQTAD